MTKAFQGNGWMIPGLFPASLLSFQRFFVKRFVGSKSRCIIFKGFLKYLKQVRQFGILHSVLIDGSFVSLKTEPGDIDISLIYYGKKAEMLDAAAISSLYLLISNEHQDENKKRFFTHPFQSLPYYPPAHEVGYASSRHFFHNAIDFWGVDREGNSKGLIIIPLAKDAIFEIGGLLP